MFTSQEDLIQKLKVLVQTANLEKKKLGERIGALERKVQQLSELKDLALEERDAFLDEIQQLKKNQAPNSKRKGSEPPKEEPLPLPALETLLVVEPPMEVPVDDAPK